MLPILHFSGTFRFDMPGYNNEPDNRAVAFQPDMPRRQVEALCRCDPFRYLQLEVQGVTRQLTVDGPTTVTADDPALGIPVTLSGLFPDVSPSAVCSQLYAGQLTVGGGALVARVRTAFQSIVRLNVRTVGFTDETVAAHLDALIDVSSLQGLAGSRFFSELGDAEMLQLHLHLNRYNRHDTGSGEKPLTGDVFGYLCPVAPEHDGAVGRLRHRKLVAHPELPDHRWGFDTYLDAPPPKGPYPPPHWIDIEGSYDLCPERRLVVLRYLDFIPYLDKRRSTPVVDRYEVRWQAPETTIVLGEFAGTHQEMLRTGGLLLLGLPDEVDLRAGGRIEVYAIRGDDQVPVVAETEWDLVLEGGRGLTLASTASATVSAQVYYRNRPVAGHPVRLVTQPNRKSPIVASLVGDELVTDESGRVQATVQAADLTSMGNVPDPVAKAPATSLPWDRAYGNYVFLKIDNPLRRNPWREEATEVVELAVRVLHRVDPARIPGQPSFKRDVRPLFAYLMRYFPWLHAQEVGGHWVRLFDLDNVEHVRSRATAIVHRLSLPDEHPGKMPRSRDFPVGGVAVLQRWIDTGMQP